MLSNKSATFFDDSSPSRIEIPGQYGLTSSRFREPRSDLHVKVVKVLPRVKCIFITGEALQYQIQILGSDGQYIPYRVQLKSCYSTSSTQNEVSYFVDIKIVNNYFFFLTIINIFFSSFFLLLVEFI